MGWGIVTGSTGFVSTFGVGLSPGLRRFSGLSGVVASGASSVTAIRRASDTISRYTSGTALRADAALRDAALARVVRGVLVVDAPGALRFGPAISSVGSKNRSN